MESQRRKVSRRSMEDEGYRPLSPPQRNKKLRSDGLEISLELEEREVVADSNDGTGRITENNVSSSHHVQPGAFAVHGPEHGSVNTFDVESLQDEESTSVVTSPAPALTRETDIHITAIPVDEDDLEAHVRSRILADAAEAQVVKPDQQNQKRMMIWVLIGVVLLGTVAGLSVGLTRGGSTNDNNTPPDQCDTVVNPDVVTQCKCFGSISNVSPETSETYRNLSLAMNLTQDDDEAMFACEADNLAVWWLANDTDHRSLSGLSPLEPFRVTQRRVLALLYISTGGTNWINQDGWLTLENECDWFGVQCDSSQQTVMRLELGSSNLNGTVPGELGLLSSLTILSLNDNSISGTLPQELLMQLKLLRRLDVSVNSIEGAIPDVVDLAALVQSGFEFLTENPNVTITDLLENPSLIGFERTLFSLDFSDNSFNGSFPSGLQLLTTLREFRADNNRLQGGILTLNHPETGLIPAFPIPEDLLFREMEHFSVRNNLLSGPLPPFIGLFTDLETVDLSDNLGTGIIPTEIGKWEELVSLNFSYNALTGTVPTELLRVAQLQTLDLRSNDLSGSLPAGICDVLVFLDPPLVDCDLHLARNCSCCECGNGP